MASHSFELSDATRGFDHQRLVGSGGHGHVYKGALMDGSPIAVKALVLPYMDNGSLESRRYPSCGSLDLSIVQKLITNVGDEAIDNMGNSSANLLFGSIGHIAPEKVVNPAFVTASRGQSREIRKKWEVAVAELIELGLLCTQELPSTRPTMLNAADDLNRLKRYLNGYTTANFASSFGISCSTW
ncbi:hypothetical protein VNO78_23005 [Psophocarpus tetragonolobus]|uniref:Uncharacterized protein n=1 Tax=Psophocarpus tetragonolobus TaxID=3891 RepID=A0AAN9S429_PSOTE